VAAASPLGVPATPDLVADAAAIATRLGLRVDEPVVLKDSLNLLVWLRPSPVVARIHARTALVRAPEAAADSLALAAHLAEAGLPVSPPADAIDPGPHVGATGRPMTFWRRLAVDETSADPAEAARTLRGLHEAMASYAGPLRHDGPIEEIGRLAEILAAKRPEAAARILAVRDMLRLPDLPAQPLHGDAHLGNVVVAAGRLRWLDWEEAWRGPLAWDLACLVHRQATLGEGGDEIGPAVDAYGSYDAAAVDAWMPAYALWAAAWGFVGDLDGLDWWIDGARRRLAWAERAVGGGAGA
jgi:Ser/Thr protein kinase RdoA (MazF antagonist)